jgi:hypothetical protein
MRVKRESRRLSAVVKKEDEDTLAVGLTPMIDEPALPDTKPVNGLGGLNDRKPAVCLILVRAARFHDLCC